MQMLADCRRRRHDIRVIVITCVLFQLFQLSSASFRASPSAAATIQSAVTVVRVNNCPKDLEYRFEPMDNSQTTRWEVGVDNFNKLIDGQCSLRFVGGSDNGRIEELVLYGQYDVDEHQWEMAPGTIKVWHKVELLQYMWISYTGIDHITILFGSGVTDVLMRSFTRGTEWNLVFPMVHSPYLHREIRILETKYPVTISGYLDEVHIGEEIPENLQLATPIQPLDSILGCIAISAVGRVDPLPIYVTAYRYGAGQHWYMDDWKLYSMANVGPSITIPEPTSWVKDQMVALGFDAAKVAAHNGNGSIAYVGNVVFMLNMSDNADIFEAHGATMPFNVSMFNQNDRALIIGGDKIIERSSLNMGEDNDFARMVLGIMSIDVNLGEDADIDIMVIIRPRDGSIEPSHSEVAWNYKPISKLSPTNDLQFINKFRHDEIDESDDKTDPPPYIEDGQQSILDDPRWKKKKDELDHQ
jgi:hypothetical protein